MARQPAPIRSVGLAATATTLVALVAMAAMVSAAPVPRGLDGAALRESHVMRAVAAAVAAAARDLLSGERCPTVVAFFEPCATGDVRATVCREHASVIVIALPTLLGERLLDLPPPTG